MYSGGEGDGYSWTQTESELEIKAPPPGRPPVTSPRCAAPTGSEARRWRSGSSRGRWRWPAAWGGQVTAGGQGSVRGVKMAALEGTLQAPIHPDESAAPPTGRAASGVSGTSKAATS